MPIDAEDLLSAARHLDRLKPPLVSDEVCARTMLNRMYYAAYLATREAIRAQLADPGFDVTHTTLSDALQRTPDADVSTLGKVLRSLRDDRERSDYQPHLTVPRSRASLRIADAHFVLDNADRLIGRFPPMRRR